MVRNDLRRGEILRLPSQPSMLNGDRPAESRNGQDPDDALLLDDLQLRACSEVQQVCRFFDLDDHPRGLTRRDDRRTFDEAHRRRTDRGPIRTFAGRNRRCASAGIGGQEENNRF